MIITVYSRRVCVQIPEFIQETTHYFAALMT